MQCYLLIILYCPQYVMGVVDGSGKHLVTISFIESDGTNDGSFDFFFYTNFAT